jgi:hypothetical protein
MKFGASKGSADFHHLSPELALTTRDHHGSAVPQAARRIRRWHLTERSAESLASYPSPLVKR